MAPFASPRVTGCSAISPKLVDKLMVNHDGR
jgi:hypothetical protein